MPIMFRCSICEIKMEGDPHNPPICPNSAAEQHKMDPYQQHQTEPGHKDRYGVQQLLFPNEDEERQRQKQAHIRKDLGRFFAMTAREFEKEFGRMLTALGYQDVQHVGQTGDKGVDLWAVSPDGERIIVQCKRYAPEKSVGTPELQRFLGAVTDQKVQCGMFVTTSSYTEQARYYAVKNRIVLVDGKQLAAMDARIRRSSSPQA